MSKTKTAAALKIADAIAERSALFQKFREGGWEVCALTPDIRAEEKQKDNYSNLNPDYLVKMPGARAMRIKTITQLYRLAKGVGK